MKGMKYSDSKPSVVGSSTVWCTAEYDESTHKPTGRVFVKVLSSGMRQALNMPIDAAVDLGLAQTPDTDGTTIIGRQVKEAVERIAPQPAFDSSMLTALVQAELAKLLAAQAAK